MINLQEMKRFEIALSYKVTIYIIYPVNFTVSVLPTDNFSLLEACEFHFCQQKRGSLVTSYVNQIFLVKQETILPIHILTR
jgi:hypothetical protein